MKLSPDLSSQDFRLPALEKAVHLVLPRVPFVNCCQFIYLIGSLLVLRAGCGIWLYQFLIIAYRFTLYMYMYQCIVRNINKHMSKAIYCKQSMVYIYLPILKKFLIYFLFIVGLNYFHFWWKNWVEYGILAYFIPWCVPLTIRVDAKSRNASES